MWKSKWDVVFWELERERESTFAWSPKFLSSTIALFIPSTIYSKHYFKYYFKNWYTLEFKMNNSVKMVICPLILWRMKELYNRHVMTIGFMLVSRFWSLKWHFQNQDLKMKMTVSSPISVLFYVTLRNFIESNQKHYNIQTDNTYHCKKKISQK